MQYIDEEDFDLLVDKLATKYGIYWREVRAQALDALEKRRFSVGPRAPIKVHIEAAEEAVEKHLRETGLVE